MAMIHILSHQAKGYTICGKEAKDTAVKTKNEVPKGR